MDTFVLLPSFIDFFQEAKHRSISPSNLAVTFLVFGILSIIYFTNYSQSPITISAF